MTWYRQPGKDQDVHRGTLARGRVVTHCGLAFAARAAARLDGPSDDHQVCRACVAGQVQRLAGTAAHSPVWRPLALAWLPRSWTRHGLADLRARSAGWRPPS